MSLAPGRSLGPYEIVAKLGEGGMGEVYRATDTKLKRQVAIKVLPASLATDRDRLARFQREAEVLASLNHPNIAGIYGIEEAGDVRALVMELVEGEDLSIVVARGPIPLTDALAIARQIAEAFEAAHDLQIIHRDLKPANIKVRADGTVKVLDFGLAKALGPAGVARAAASDPANSPTITSPAITEMGLILGTAAYMAPEQARGRVVDKRSDIWAFGVVLFEMLTGKRAFRGEDVTDTLAAVLQREPDWQALPGGTPPPVRVLLRRCLEKDPKRRLHDIADARIEIDEARSGARDVAMMPAPAASRKGTLLTWGLTVIVASAVAAAAGWFLRPVPVALESRLEINTPPTTDWPFAISPDGRKVVFVAASGGPMQLWLRSLDDTVPRPLPGTARGTSPFWSPDGKSIGFFADAKLLRVDIDGGSVRTLATGVAVPIGGTWGRDGTILFSANPNGPVQRTTAEGGAPIDVTRVEEPLERGHFSPQLLPGGRRFLFYMNGTAEVTGVYVGELDTGRKTRLFAASGSALYVPGYLVFPRGGEVLAQAFDASRATLSDDVVTLAQGLQGRVTLSASPDGTIGYRTTPGDSGQRQLVWVDRTGQERERLVYDGSAAQSPALSHDGRYVAIFRFLNSNMDVWSYDRTRELWDRLTYAPGDDIYPLWSRDGRSIIYSGVRNRAPLGLYKRHLSEPPESERPLLKAGGENAMDWSPDDKYILFSRGGPKGDLDIWALSMVDPRAEPFAVVATDANESLPQFSPDGKWIAYESDKLGREEIYVRPFPGPGPDVRVSSDGGIQARWNPKADELFYLGGDDRMMAVPIRIRPDGSVDAGKAEGLFPTNIGSTVRLRYRQQYVVAPDGKSFGLNSVVDQPRPSPIVLILNWKPSR